MALIVMFVMFVIAAFSGLTGSGLYARANHQQILQQRTQLHAPEGYKPVWAFFWEMFGVLQVIDILRSLNLEQLRTPGADSVVRKLSVGLLGI